MSINLYTNDADMGLKAGEKYYLLTVSGGEIKITKESDV